MPLQDHRSLQPSVPFTHPRLDLKAIALHARNAEYNPKVRIDLSLTRNTSNSLSCSLF